MLSDLHLGGQGDFQIFTESHRLAWLIDFLRLQPPERHIALVLNGDIVDFLADQDAQCFDPRGASDKLGRILDDPAFQPVWQALRSWVRTARRTLVLILGNHDIELGLPAVSDRLLDALSGDDAAARGRIRLLCDNSGFACTVGSANILCVHGNEVDKYNIVDHDSLRQVAVAMNRGLELPEFVSNAGSYLVVKIMNKIKRRYPFVDLLKPETRAALSLLALIGDESVHATIRQVFDFSVATAQGQRAVSAGRLGAEAPSRSDGKPGMPAELQPLYEAALSSAWTGAARPMDSEDRLFRQAEQDLGQGLSPSECALPDPRDPRAATLGGFATYLWGWLTGQNPDETIRAALAEWLQNDHTFAVDEPDEQFQSLSATTSPQVDFLVAGHTHLARALRRETGGYYFNSGTWSRLIELTPALLGDAKRFAAVLAAMRAGSMQELEGIPGLVGTRPTVVCLRAASGAVVGSLEEVRASASGSYELVAAQLNSREGAAGVTRFVQE